MSFMSDDHLRMGLFGCYLFFPTHCAELAFQALKRQLILSDRNIQNMQTISEYVSDNLYYLDPIPILCYTLRTQRDLYHCCS